MEKGNFFRCCVAGTAVRLAPEEESNKLTGFEHNAVTPIGMRTDIPVSLISLPMWTTMHLHLNCITSIRVALMSVISRIHVTLHIFILVKFVRGFCLLYLMVEYRSTDLS